MAFLVAPLSVASPARTAIGGEDGRTGTIQPPRSNGGYCYRALSLSSATCRVLCRRSSAYSIGGPTTSIPYLVPASIARSMSSGIGGGTVNC